MTASDPTAPTMRAMVLKALSLGYQFGFEIMDVTGLPSGTVYPALRRLERDGLVTSNWEAEDAALKESRPARRYSIPVFSATVRMAPESSAAACSTAISWWITMTARSG